MMVIELIYRWSAELKNYLKIYRKRVFYMFLTLFLIATITFFLMKLFTWSPYATLKNRQVTQAQLEIGECQAVGPDKPLYLPHT